MAAPNPSSSGLVSYLVSAFWTIGRLCDGGSALWSRDGRSFSFRGEGIGFFPRLAPRHFFGEIPLPPEPVAPGASKAEGALNRWLRFDASSMRSSLARGCPMRSRSSYCADSFEFDFSGRGPPLAPFPRSRRRPVQSKCSSSVVANVFFLTSPPPLISLSLSLPFYPSSSMDSARPARTCGSATLPPPSPWPTSSSRPWDPSASTRCSSTTLEM